MYSVLFLIVGYIGIFALGRTIIAPTLDLNATGAPPIWPFLMVTISCGAILGFHSLVGSGTTSKQLIHHGRYYIFSWRVRTIRSSFCVLCSVKHG
ncbi:hypothetical protein C4E24_07480 [ANME-1 cluster archaeon AG-394-G21]|nr:hypothetical protein [ANME-1 cluster archaeon AG-394-G21]